MADTALIDPTADTKETGFLDRLRQRAVALAYGSPFYGLTLSGATPDALRMGLTDPWPGNADTGRDLISGVLDFAGQRVECPPEPPTWMPAGVSDEWIAAMHGFEWLRDLRAVGGDAARRQARLMMASWLDHYSGWDATAWRPDITGRRLANWIAFHDFVYASADDDFRSRVFRSMARQARHLIRVIPATRKGPGRIAAIKGLAYAGLCLPGGDLRLALALKLLRPELNRQILPDGGHISRNPGELLNTLRHAVDLRNALRTAQHDIPDALQHSIDRMSPALRFFRHGDNELALFNGAQEASAVLCDTVLTQSGSRGRPLQTAPHSGYERIVHGRSCLIADCGMPPPPGYDSAAHAGAFSFEMSHGKNRLIVNCGAYPGPGPWADALRHTAAHSTLSIAGDDILGFAPDGSVIRRPSGMNATRNNAPEGTLLDMTHNAFHATHGVIHSRMLFMAKSGEDLRGEDILRATPGHEFTIRFHLHPDVSAFITRSNSEVMMKTARSRGGWRFRAQGARMELEDSVYFGKGAKPRRNQQITLSGRTLDGQTTIKWALQRLKT